MHFEFETHGVEDGEEFLQRDREKGRLPLFLFSSLIFTCYHAHNLCLSLSSAPNFTSTELISGKGRTYHVLLEFPSHLVPHVISILTASQSF